MKRREFIELFGGAAMAWPIAAHAQQPAMPVIGFLSSGSPNALATLVATFGEGLNEAGYVEHRNIGIEYRWAEGQYERLPALAADLARRQVSLIAATGGLQSALAAKATTGTIPIVFQIGADPVKWGLVSSLARPGANITGVSSLNVELVPKRMQLLHELLPNATIIAALVNPRSNYPNLQAAADSLGLKLKIVQASGDRDFDTAFTTIAQMQGSGLLITADPFFNSRLDQLADLALQHAVPAIYQYPEFASAGGLMSYGGSYKDQYRLAGIYTGRVLKGEKPADLPVLRPSKFELVINLQTARTLGIEVPTTLLARADEVIE